MLKVRFKEYILQFNFAAGTSRGILHRKKSWFILISDGQQHMPAIGECSPIPGLSRDAADNISEKIQHVCHAIENDEDLPNDLNKFPAVRFGIETALRDLKHKGDKKLFPSEFTRGKVGISINGLIWMGSKQDMYKRIEQKIDQGFRCLKLKIGAIGFDDELDLLRQIRKSFQPQDLEIRLDANGAFTPDEALQKLRALSKFHIHSLEQPIKPGFTEKMAFLCEKSPIPIALDEELIGHFNTIQKEKLLKDINPSYIIIKPTLLGGFKESEEWISIANKKNTGWWITSALESNIGLNSIAQWTHTFKTNMYQGLGTGMLYSNNIPSPLHITGEKLWYNPQKSWDLRFFE